MKTINFTFFEKLKIIFGYNNNLSFYCYLNNKKCYVNLERVKQYPNGYLKIVK
jgi:hypothetical protein